MIQPKIQEVENKRHKEYLVYLNSLERNEEGGIISFLPKENWLLRNHITFTPEEFEAFKREFGGKLLEKAAENAKLGYDRVLWDDPKEGDDAYMNIPKVDKESIINTLDDYLLNNKI